MPILSLGRRWQGVSAGWLTKPARHTRLPKAGLEFTPAAAKEMMTYGVWEEGQGGLSREARPGWRRGPAPASEAAAGTDAASAAGRASPGGRRGHRWSGQCERQQQRSRGLECDGTDGPRVRSGAGIVEEAAGPRGWHAGLDGERAETAREQGPHGAAAGGRGSQDHARRCTHEARLFAPREPAGCRAPSPPHPTAGSQRVTMKGRRQPPKTQPTRKGAEIRWA